MLSPIQKFAMFVRDLTGQPEGSVVQIGRENFRRDDLTGLQIAIDSLTQARRLSQSKSYNGDTEVMNHSQQRQQNFTVNFYGDGAYDVADKFMLLISSQKGYELARDLGIDVYLPGGLTDVKLLTGEQYSERYEMECNVIFTATTAVEVLRIDTAQTEITEG